MPKRRHLSETQQRGLTLIELLTVIAIVASLVALLLPAVQSARSASRKLACQNHLKQLGLAVAGFESATRYLPSATYGDPYNVPGPGGSAFTKLLPYVEEQPVADRYNWQLEWFAEENQPAVNSPIATFRCPASPGGHLQQGLAKTPSRNDAPEQTAAVTDFAAVYSWGFPFAVRAADYPNDPWAVGALSPTPEEVSATLSPAAVRRQPRRVDTTDSASKTLTFIERAAPTDRWIGGELTEANPATARAWAPWAGQACIWLLSYVDQGRQWAPGGLGPCNINCNNHQGVYGFHEVGANALYLDGSVRMLSQNLHAIVLHAMVSRSRGDDLEATF